MLKTNCVVIPCADTKGLESKQLLEDLLNSLKDFIGTIICCMDGCAESFNYYFQEIYKGNPNIIYLINEGNRLGFAANSNKGLRYAFKTLEAERVMLCNMDCILPSWVYLKPLFMNEGLVSATSVEESFYKDQGLDLNGLNQSVDDGPGLEYNLVEKFAGYCWVIHKNVVEKIGYLDERFIAGWDDDDYCARVRLAGFPVGVLNVYVNHKGSHIDQAAHGGSMTGAYDNERLMLNMQKFYWKYQIPGGISHALSPKWINENHSWCEDLYES